MKFVSLSHLHWEAAHATHIRAAETAHAAHTRHHFLALFAAELLHQLLHLLELVAKTVAAEWFVPQTFQR